LDAGKNPRKFACPRLDHRRVPEAEFFDVIGKKKPLEFSSSTKLYFMNSASVLVFMVKPASEHLKRFYWNWKDC
jgi:hypothetical protein